MRVDPGFRGMDGVWLGSREWMGFGWDLENGMMLFVVLDRRVGSSGVGSVYGGNGVQPPGTESRSIGLNPIWFAE
jgi:hypothetical protein